MNFDFADLVVFASIVELFFFVIFISLKNGKPYYNKVLVAFFVFQAIGIVSWMLVKYNVQIKLAYILTSFDLIWAPSLFLYVEALTTKRDKLNIYWFYHGIPFIVAFIYTLLSLFFELPRLPFTLIIYTLVAVYSVAGLVVLYKYHKEVEKNFSQDESSIRNWVAVVLWGYILAGTVPLLIEHLGMYNTNSKVLKDFIDFFPFLLFYNILFFNAIGNTVVINEIPREEKYSGSLLSPTSAEEYLNKLDKVVEVEKCYLEPELTLSSLSEVTGIPSRYLSQVINQYKKKSFYDYINGLRTDYACNILVTDSKKTILEVLYESGFNSKTSFNTSFKKHTGLTPSQYKTKFQKK